MTAPSIAKTDGRNTPEKVPNLLPVHTNLVHSCPVYKNYYFNLQVSYRNMLCLASTSNPAKCTHLFFLAAIASFAALMISCRVRPNFLKRSSGFPDSPNLSITATYLMGTGCVVDKASATAPPRPP